MTRDDVLSVIKHHIYAIFPDAKNVEIDEHKPIQDLGLDSLEMVEIVSRSMKQLNIKVPRAELMQVISLTQLLNIFEKYANQAVNEEVLSTE